MSNKKPTNLTEEELKSIQDQQRKINTLLQEIGILETKKHAHLHELAAVNEDVNSYKKSLEEKYGSVSINLSDGSFKEIEDVNN